METEHPSIVVLISLKELLALLLYTFINTSPHHHPITILSNLQKEKKGLPTKYFNVLSLPPGADIDIAQIITFSVSCSNTHMAFSIFCRLAYHRKCTELSTGG